MVLRKFLIIGLLVLGIAAAAVLLFYAGDHDDEYRDSVRNQKPGIDIDRG
ncbi:MAG TPA: hypothetical protein VNO35_08210 [Steroidobacteraceae bacterium]|nr:hypothetical protein [Steroidobacteraceae bacterium]